MKHLPEDLLLDEDGKIVLPIPELPPLRRYTHQNDRPSAAIRPHEGPVLTLIHRTPSGRLTTTIAAWKGKLTPEALAKKMANYLPVLAVRAPGHTLQEAFVSDNPGPTWASWKNNITAFEDHRGA